MVKEPSTDKREELAFSTITLNGTEVNAEVLATKKSLPQGLLIAADHIVTEI